MGHQKGLGQSLTVLIFDDDFDDEKLICANFPVSISEVGPHETTAKDNAEQIQSVIKDNKMERIAKELF